MNNKYQLGIIGAGVMGGTIVRSLLASKAFLNNQILVADPDQKKLGSLNKKYQIKVFNQNDRLVRHCQIIILAVKPQHFQEVAESISKPIRADKLFISIMAGINIKTLIKYLGHKNLIRTMPNLAARVEKSITVWYASRFVSNKSKLLLRKILKSIGEEIEVKNEREIDVATAVSGSGPAYIFYLMEIFEKAGLLLDFEKSKIKKLTDYTFEGALRLYKNTQESTYSLREKVTSKGGTTEAAFKILKAKKVDQIWIKAIIAAYRRALKLQKIYE